MTTQPAAKPTTRTPGKAKLRLVPDPPKLSAKQAKDLAAADAKVNAAKAKYDAAVKARDKVRDRLRVRLPSGEEFTTGGFTVKRSAYSFDTFSLKGYLAAGFKVTPQMRKHVTAQHGERWTVKPVK